MSSLKLLTRFSQEYGAENIAIFTANSETLTPALQEFLNKQETKLDGEPLIIGCQDVKGFEAVRDGERVDKSIVGPALLELSRKV